MYLIKVQEASDEKNEREEGTDQEEKGMNDTNLKKSVHAINGIASRGYKTMKVTVHVKKKAFHILIDFGSTNNFLDIEIAKKLGCNMTSINPMTVDMANCHASTRKGRHVAIVACP